MSILSQSVNGTARSGQAGERSLFRPAFYQQADDAEAIRKSGWRYLN
jgi:hypothetical protein